MDEQWKALYRAMTAALKKTGQDMTIPLPERPGTQWNLEKAPHGLGLCTHCGKGYNSHGSPNSPLDCPAPDAAWDAYYDARAAENIETTVTRIQHMLRGYSHAQRIAILIRAGAHDD